MLLTKDKIIELVATVMGLIINSITMVALCSWGKRKLTNRARLLVSITAANLVAAIGVVISLLAAVYRPATNMFCYKWTDMLVEDIRISGTILITLGLCSLSLDLYLTVNHSLQYQIHSRPITSVTIASNWILGIFLGALSFLVKLAKSENSVQEARAQCNIDKLLVTKHSNTSAGLATPLKFTPQNWKLVNYITLPPLPSNYVEISAPLYLPRSRDSSSTRNNWTPVTIPPLPPVPLHGNDLLSISTPRSPAQPQSNGTILMHMSRYFGYATQTVVTAIGLLLISTFLALIFRRILRPVCGQRRVIASRRRGACTIFLLLLTFIITMLPGLLTELYMLVQVVLHTGSEIIRDEVYHFMWVQPYLDALTTCYAVASPIILYTRMREVRKSYRHVLFGFKQKFQRSSGADVGGALTAATGVGETAAVRSATVAATLLASSNNVASRRHRQRSQNDAEQESDESNNSNENLLHLNGRCTLSSPSDNWAGNEDDIRHLITHSTPL